ncbi:MAG: LytTR family DNA-binding domain-containing protein [Bacteroidales bacterium]|nr:LytTR family DNA-binding domain-containing protein [Bacteroidales bacterium]
MINIVIIENDPKITDAITQVVSHYFEQFRVVEVTTDIHSGRQAIMNHHPDLVIMESNLPDGSTIEMQKNLPEIHFEIIFLSANQDEALQAIQTGAFGFLIKPLNTTSFVKILIKLKLEIEKKKVIFSYCRQCPELKKENSTLVLHTLTDIHIIQPKDILYCMSEGSYTHFYMTNQSAIMVSKNLKEFENKLTKQKFLRVHHTYFVNMQHVAKFNKANGGMIFLNDGTQIPVSVRKKADLFKLLEAIPQQ